MPEDQHPRAGRQALNAPQPGLHRARLDVPELLAADHRVHVNAQPGLDRQARRRIEGLPLDPLAAARNLACRWMSLRIPGLEGTRPLLPPRWQLRRKDPLRTPSPEPKIPAVPGQSELYSPA